MTTLGDINCEIWGFILEQFPAARYKAFSDDDSLLDSGIIDSMGILEMVAFMESQFEVTITDEDLSPENFRSVDSLSRFLKLKIDR
jgi:acyl carrier protein